MAWFNDSLSAAIKAASRLNPLARLTGTTGMASLFSHQLAIAAYMQSGMMRKAIAIPAEDRVREWRDWQADDKQIEAIENEEKRLGLIAKVQEAETLRGIGGGALIIITAGDHATPLMPEQIGKEGIVAINVVSRWQITGRDWNKELSSPEYGQPTYFEMDGGKSGNRTRIHPSRVICFRGPRLPAGSAMSDEEAFWGDSRLLRVYNEVSRSDETQAWFADLVRKAKLLRIGIPDLDSRDPEKLQKRIEVIAMGESSLSATVYRSGATKDDAGEVIGDYQVSWAGIPAMMDAFDQRIAAVSDIPFTRLMGRSPAGMNATGEHDMNNWNRAVKSGQSLELRPCLEMLDPLLLASAGVSETEEQKIWWDFAPLDVPSEKVIADTFFTTMQAIEKVVGTGAIPEEAQSEAIQNTIVEGGWMPGLDQALAKIPDAERFGMNPDNDGTDPSAIQARGGDPNDLAGGGQSGSGSPARRAANDAATWLADAEPRPLYVQRKLLNAAELIAWAKSNGFSSTLTAYDMHVTVLYSRSPVDPMKMGRDWYEDDKGQIVVKPGGPRVIERLGENAVVLRFSHPSLEYRHRDMIEAGGSHDYPEYAPHVTISYEVPESVDLETLTPFNGVLRFGPEIFDALDLDWKSKIAES